MLRSAPSSLQRPSARATLALLFLGGLALSLAMVARSQVGGDQLNLLARGWLWVADGVFTPHGNPLSTGGNAPGAITTVLVGLPLFLWRDHRAPTLLVLLFHVVAYVILDRLVSRLLGPRARIPFALLYWLNPWRLYYSAFLWNPNYLFLFGAIHLWAIERQREQARFGASCALAASVGLALQVHPSALLLIASSGLLWLRRSFRLSIPAAILGVALAAIPLIPWYLGVEVGQEAALSAADKGFLGRGLLYVFPLLRGLLYWFRYASLAISGKIAHFDFVALGGTETDRWLAPLAQGVMILGGLTVIAAFLATWRLLRNARRRGWFRAPHWLAVFRQARSAAGSNRRFVEEYALATFVGAVVIFAIAPTTIMSWQGLVILHAAVLPPLLLVSALLRSRHKHRTQRALTAASVVGGLLLVALTWGAPHYRCAGRYGIHLALVSDHPMLHELHIVDGGPDGPDGPDSQGRSGGCPLPLNQPDGWWPDVLPKGRVSQ